MMKLDQALKENSYVEKIFRCPTTGFVVFYFFLHAAYMKIIEADSVFFKPLFPATKACVTRSRIVVWPIPDRCNGGGF
jgi:hypothetical protein